MGLFSKFKQRPKMVASVRLPFAEPGIKAVGSHYFEDNIRKVPAGKPELQLVAAPDADWGKVQVFWDGLRIPRHGTGLRAEHNSSPVGRVVP